VFHPELIEPVKTVAAAHNIEAAFIAAIVMQESGGNSFKCRFEEGWKYFLKPSEWAPKVGTSYPTECSQQATSWGLMQVIGSTAREMGYEGLFPMLTGPVCGLKWGCLFLEHLSHRKDEQEKIVFNEKLCAAYNAGSPKRAADGKWVNQGYVNGVNKFYDELKATEAFSG
jgi:hypothetical protein